MSDRERNRKDFLTPLEFYTYLFNQVNRIAYFYKENSPLLRSPNNFDEVLNISVGEDTCSFVFSTTKLNIARPEIPEGAYDNSFNFLFDPEIMSLEYTEALPTREQKITILINDYEDITSLKNAMVPFFEKFNRLLEYFNLTNTVKIPN